VLKICEVIPLFGFYFSGKRGCVPTKLGIERGGTEAAYFSFSNLSPLSSDKSTGTICD
jgi:hypothetical protein